MDVVVGDTETRTAVEAEGDRFRRRLSKALTVAEKFKSKYSFELEVNKELGRRNKELRAAQRDDQILLAQVRNELLLTQQKLLDQGNVDSDMVRTHRTVVRELGRRNEELKEKHVNDQNLLTEMMHENTSLKQQLETLRCSFNQLLLKQQVSSNVRQEISNQSANTPESTPSLTTSDCHNSSNSSSAVPGPREGDPPDSVTGRPSPRSDDSKLFEHFLVVGADTIHPVTSTLPSSSMSPSNDSSGSGSGSGIGIDSSFDQILSDLMTSAVNQMTSTAGIVIPPSPGDVFERSGLATKDSHTITNATTTTTATISAPTKLLYCYPEQEDSSDGNSLAHGMCDFCLPTGTGFTARATLLPHHFSEESTMDDASRTAKRLSSVHHRASSVLPSQTMVFVVEDKNNGAEGRARGRR